MRFRSGRRNSPIARLELQRLIDCYLDLYVDFVILEQRVQGKLPAFEGIRIVKERMETGEDLTEKRGDE